MKIALHKLYLILNSEPLHVHPQTRLNAVITCDKHIAAAMSVNSYLSCFPVSLV